MDKLKHFIIEYEESRPSTFAMIIGIVITLVAIALFISDISNIFSQSFLDTATLSQTIIYMLGALAGVVLIVVFIWSSVTYIINYQKYWNGEILKGKTEINCKRIIEIKEAPPIVSEKPIKPKPIKYKTIWKEK